MTQGHLLLQKSPELRGSVSLAGAKNAVLGIMAALILTEGVSTLENVPNSADVHHMITLLKSLGASIQFDQEKNYLCFFNIEEIEKVSNSNVIIDVNTYKFKFSGKTSESLFFKMSELTHSSSEYFSPAKYINNEKGYVAFEMKLVEQDSPAKIKLNCDNTKTWELLDIFRWKRYQCELVFSDQ